MADAGLEAELVASLVASRGRKGARAILQAAPAGDAAPAITAGERRQAELLAAQCGRQGLTLLDAGHPDFPPLLAHIPDPPLVLCVRGQLERLRLPAVAVVGARRCTHLGRCVAEGLAEGVAAAGWLVVSGLARGIDASAHRAALGSGLTAAVLGNGLSAPYPRCHRSLADQIVDTGGLLISEYLPWAEPRPYHFPERNRLISGLSRGVVVVEAGERSGSLITARMALEQGRDVMAVPGPVSNPMSRGCHRLIRQGAALVESVDQVFEVLGVEPEHAPAVARLAAGSVAVDQRRPDGAPLGGPAGNAAGPSGSAWADAGAMALTPEHRAVLDALDQTLTSLDRLAAALGQPAQRLVPLLVELELAGFVEQVPGGYIRLPSRRVSH